MIDRRTSMQLAAATALGALLGKARAQPYVDPAQEELPFPLFSFVRQPWRSYLEATPGRTFIDGLGIVWGQSVPGRSDAAVAADLAAAGFRRARLEIPWGAMRWDEGGLEAGPAAHAASVLRACSAHAIRPLILLNAHHGAPCPMSVQTRALAEAAPRGSRRIRVQGGALGISPGSNTVLTLADGGHAGPLVTAVADDGTLTLSRATPRALPPDAPLEIAQLRYPPLHPVGTAEFELTLGGWLRYVDYVTRLVTALVGPDFDVEVWNELTFGSDFLDVNAYSDDPPAAGAPDFLRPGGSAWELARRTVARIAELNPAAQVIWGFSNTTFFHTAIADLPPGFKGQSYHPYGVAPRCYAPIVAGKERYNVDRFVPSGCATQPEGWAHTFQQTETLTRLLNPAARKAHPAGVGTFFHYFTEHGFNSRELGISDRATALRAKAKFLLRAPLFWLNKGLAGLYVYVDYEPDDLSFGMLAQDGLPSPALQALRRLVGRFAGALPLPASRPLGAVVRRVGGPVGVYANDPAGTVVSQEDVVALLPFQINANRFIVGAYVMTEDFPADLPPQPYEITLRGIGGDAASVNCYDPLDDKIVRVNIRNVTGANIVVQVPLTDTPRLLEITVT